jgi:hypothetical protein
MRGIGAPKGGGGVTGLQPLPKAIFKKKTDFVDMVISKVLRDVCFSLNKSTKSAHD